MAGETSHYVTKELTSDTLPDFERLFEERPAPGAYMCWCMYHHRARPLPWRKGPKARAQRAARNRQDRRELVRSGRSHGILVYFGGEPVGWCQYGPREELPRFDHRYRDLAPEGDTERLWRITCFVVRAKFRRRGVASAALRAALDAIRGRGGGLVEAYPILRWGAYQEYLGTLSMFQKEGFEVVAPLGESNAVVRRRIGSPSGAP